MMANHTWCHYISILILHTKSNHASRTLFTV
jgi:hypothetical protein